MLPLGSAGSHQDCLDEQQFIEEEYYIEEEVEESIEDESVKTRGVDTIKEVSSGHERDSPSDGGTRQGPMGTILQTVSLSPGKRRHADSVQLT